eukprot:11732362-Prorocentrum_lima.AAC.1
MIKESKLKDQPDLWLARECAKRQKLLQEERANRLWQQQQQMEKKAATFPCGKGERDVAPAEAKGV